MQILLRRRNRTIGKNLGLSLAAEGSKSATRCALSPLTGGLSVLIEFFERIGLGEQLEEHQPYCAKSPNHYPPRQILVGFMLSAIAGARRFAHSKQLRADRALHALLGMKRFPSATRF
jgi:hypothetical protein